jgi:hypothetical protein
MPLTNTQRKHAAAILGRATDGCLRMPLWGFHPYYRPLVLSERRRRNILQGDPEPIGDPEYS